MFAIRLARRLLNTTKKKATSKKPSTTTHKLTKRNISTIFKSALKPINKQYLKKPLYSPNYIGTQCTAALMTLSYRKFHVSPKPKWATPDELTTSDLRRECERRKLSSKGSRSMLIERLMTNLSELGGSDNGLTSDATLVAAKRDIETQLNRIPEKHHSTAYLYIEERFQKKLVDEFKDSRISFHNDAPSHIKLDGKYADICHLRSQITNTVADISSRETIYSLPHHIVLRLKRSILSDIRRTHDVNFTIMRHKHNGEDMMLVAIEGEPQQRMAACDTLEDVVGRVKNHSMDIPGIENYTTDKDEKVNVTGLFSSNGGKTGINPTSIGNSVADCYNVFNGVVLYLDPRMREMMHDYQSRLDKIAQDTNTNIYLGNRDLFWLNEFQLGIEGDKDNVGNARTQLDQMIIN